MPVMNALSLQADYPPIAFADADWQWFCERCVRWNC